jgi:hypothetical protein
MNAGPASELPQSSSSAFVVKRQIDLRLADVRSGFIMERSSGLRRQTDI